MIELIELESISILIDTHIFSSITVGCSRELYPTLFSFLLNVSLPVSRIFMFSVVFYRSACDDFLLYSTV